MPRNLCQWMFTKWACTSTSWCRHMCMSWQSAVSGNYPPWSNTNTLTCFLVPSFESLGKWSGTCSSFCWFRTKRQSMVVSAFFFKKNIMFYHVLSEDLTIGWWHSGSCMIMRLFQPFQRAFPLLHQTVLITCHWDPPSLVFVFLSLLRYVQIKPITWAYGAIPDVEVLLVSDPLKSANFPMHAEVALNGAG